MNNKIIPRILLFCLVVLTSISLMGKFTILSITAMILISTAMMFHGAINMVEDELVSSVHEEKNVITMINFNPNSLKLQLQRKRKNKKLFMHFQARENLGNLLSNIPNKSLLKAQMANYFKVVDYISQSEDIDLKLQQLESIVELYEKFFQSLNLCIKDSEDFQSIFSMNLSVDFYDGRKESVELCKKILNLIKKGEQDEH